MILTKDQACRYMKHTLIPEISVQGQKKILDSSVLLYADASDRVSLALYYLAASGVGQVYCSMDNISNWEELSKNLSDLNSDAKVQLQAKEAMEISGGQAATRIIAGDFSFVNKTLQSVIKYENPQGNIPTIICIHRGWRGVVQTFTGQTGLKEFLEGMAEYPDSSIIDASGCSDNLSAFFSSLMAVIEHVKLTLSLGKLLSEALYYDLSSMEFDFMSNQADLLDKLLGPHGPEKGCDTLSASRVLIMGCGGSGSSAAFALASSGIGKLGLVDFDAVGLSNLNRQIMHSASRIGMPKVQSAEVFLKQTNPNISLETYNKGISKENIQDIISSYDIIIGSIDDPAPRSILKYACHTAKKPLLEAGALDISGIATSIIPEISPCSRCISLEPGDSILLASCCESGVLGPVPGILGVIQAAEAVKLLTGSGISLKNRMLLYDVFDTDIYVTDCGKIHCCRSFS
ncbi:MAG TPA: ThiF family adenylyltransferase [Clostridia bacterium]|nr:ThiF family adenylyltransferase [Clostridia bacterium]